MRNAGGQHVVESGDAVGGDEQQMLVVDTVHIADFAAGVKFQFGKVGLQEDGVEEFERLMSNFTGKKLRVF